MSAPMVRAILDRTKTQTRRVISPQPVATEILQDDEDGAPQATFVVRGRVRMPLRYGSREVPCPYGQPGDRLWVREEHHIILRDPRAVSVRYLADGEIRPEVTIGPREHALFLGRKKPDAVTRARFMWRCLSRLTLEVTAVRVERLHDIGEADAQAEGCALECMTPTGDDSGSAIYGPGGYRALWESINGDGSWALNPWVWVVEFRRVEGMQP
jgi:hypothetical protein